MPYLYLSIHLYLQQGGRDALLYLHTNTKGHGSSSLWGRDRSRSSLDEGLSAFGTSAFQLLFGEQDGSSDEAAETEQDYFAIKELLQPFRRLGSGADGGVVHMAATVLYILGKYLPLASASARPMLPVQQAIRVGGDTDTTACLVGAVVGAYFGEEVLKKAADGRLYEGLENGVWGRDWGLGLAEQLGQFCGRGGAV